MNTNSAASLFLRNIKIILDIDITFISTLDIAITDVMKNKYDVEIDNIKKHLGKYYCSGYKTLKEINDNLNSEKINNISMYDFDRMKIDFSEKLIRFIENNLNNEQITILQNILTTTKKLILPKLFEYSKDTLNIKKNIEIFDRITQHIYQYFKGTQPVEFKFNIHKEIISFDNKKIINIFEILLFCINCLTFTCADTASCTLSNLSDEFI